MSHCTTIVTSLTIVNLYGIGLVPLFFSVERLPPPPSFDSDWQLQKLLCQSSCKSIMKMMCTCFKMIVNCFWLIRIMSCGDANQHWAYIVPFFPALVFAAATRTPKWVFLNFSKIEAGCTLLGNYWRREGLALKKFE